jgi:DNA repair protein SbcC/Rad50
MKPLRLEVSAFGPFAGSEIVDFESLGPEALFLIHGATGSGKSTLLDAMCFALYGQSLGGDRTGEQLRSDHADPADFTQVQFDFSVGSRRFRVIRSPQQERLKKSGTGSTKVGPKATLLDGGADFAPMAEGKKKVDRAVAKVLGFACDDFRQVVMIPQGRFRELLSAGSKDRQEVLARIFHTERFKDLIDRLKAAHKELETQAGEGKARVDQLLGAHDVETVEGLEKRIENGDKECERLNSELLGLTETVKNQEAQLAALEADGRILEAYQVAVDALKKAQGDAPRIQVLKTQLQLARKAVPLTTHLEVLQGLRKKLESASGEVVIAGLAASQGAETLKSAAVVRDKALEDQQELPALRSTETELGGLGKLLDTIENLEEKCAKRVEKVEQAHIEYKKNDALSEQLSGRLADLQTRIKHRRDQAVLERELALHRKQVEVARKHAAHDLKLKAIEDHISLKHDQHQQLLQQLEVAESEEALGRKVRMQDLAVSLAESLQSESACPVCGSTDHPQPAQPGETSIDQVKMDALSESVVLLKGETEVAQKALSAEQLRKEGIKGQRDALEVGELPLGELTLQLTELESRFQFAKSEQTLEALEAAVSPLQVQVEAVKGASVKALVESMSAKEALVVERKSLREAEELLPEGLGSLAQVQARIAETILRIQSIETALLTAQEAYAEAVSVQGRTAEALKQQANQKTELQQGVNTAQDQVEKALGNAGFSSLSEWKKASLTGAEQDGLEASITKAEAVLIAAVDTESRTRKDVAQVKSQGGLVEKRTQVAQSRATCDNMNRRLGGYQRTVEQFRDTLEQVIALKAKGGAIEARYAIAGQLADVARGKNPAKLDFERYVLGVMLDEVLESAASRLKGMSRGRYSLHRALALEDGRRVAGLDLNVMDHWTGHARSVATLSGGEGFLAALALALGLADVIQSTTGGIHLEAVFIDEGFGSLDPEALEMAMRALEDLRQSGRMVGLISHVAELKERIDTRVEVRRSRNGSRVQIVQS